MTPLLADLSFLQEIILTLISTIVPTAILVFGGAKFLNLYELAKKRREQEIELARFVRERQYEAVAELYEYFAEFMRLFRMVNSADTNLEDDKTRIQLFAEASTVEAKVDSLILRIASEFTHQNPEALERDLADLRQSAQLWRERIRKKKKLPFRNSEQADYVRFKNAFTHVATHIANEIYRSLDAPQLSPDEARDILFEVFSNRHERYGAHL